jgi:serine/threonine protein kinase/ABC-type transport system substrate-binding protein
MTMSCKDRYRTGREIGRGGMGIVCEGFDTKTNRRVALKFLNVRGSSPEELRRWFEREIRIHASLRHEAILQLYDYCDDDIEHPFYAMDLVSGGPPKGPSLSARLEAGQEFSFPQILEIARQLASALAYLRSREVIHLDLKPANLLLEDRMDGGVRVLISDFSCASSSGEETLTVPGMARGTPDYWAPEQANGNLPHPTMDVWGFGAVMHRLLTGRPPRGTSTLERITRPDVPADFVAMIAACLEHDPDRRLDGETLWQRLTAIGGTKAKVTVDNSRAIGRDRELRQLEQLLEESRAQSRFALVGGPDGVGKSRLMDALERRAHAAGTLVLRAVVRGDASAPYAALCQVIEDYFQRSTDPANFSDIAGELVRRFPLLHHLRQLPHDERSRRTRPADRQELFALLAGAFRRMAARQHILVIIENLHRGNVSIDAMRTIAAQAGLARLFLVATYDSDVINDDLRALRDTVRDSPAVYMDILLRPLSMDDERRLIAELLGSDDIASDTLLRIRAQSAGMPLITSLLIKDWRDPANAALERDLDGRWSLRPDADITAYALPSMQELIGRHIMRLQTGLRSLLEQASVAIDTFSIAELSLLSGRKEKALEKDVAKLITAGYLREDRGRFAFERRSYQQWVHDSLPSGSRREWHLKLAAHIESLPFRPNTNTHGQLLAHYREARVPEKIREHGIRHAQLCLDGMDPKAAISAANAVLQESDSDRTSALAYLYLAKAHKLDDDVDHGLPSCTRAYTSFSHGGDTAQMLIVATLAVEIARQHHRMREFRQWLAAGIRLAREREDKPALAHLLQYQATSEALHGKDKEAEDAAAELKTLMPLELAPAGRHGTLRIPFGSPLDSIDPVSSNLRWTADIAALVFDTLTRIDDFGCVRPWLAATVEPTDDFRRYNFIIRQGVRFHNGETCTAHDVKWSFERLLRRAAQLHQILPDDIAGAADFIAGHAQNVSGIDISADGRALTVQLTRPLPGFGHMLSDPAFSIVPYGTDELPKDWRFGLVGTGPYYLERFDLKHEMVFKANPEYWFGDLPRNDEVIISLGLSPDRIAEGFRNGEFSLAFDLTSKEHDRLRVDLAHGWQYARKPTLATCFAAFNVHRGPLASKSAREALIAAMSTQIDGIVKNVRGMAIPAYGLFPPALLEVERHRRVSESATASSAELTAVCSLTFATTFPGVANAIIDALSNDFRIKLMAAPSKQIASAPEADIYFSYFACDYPDLDGFALPLLHSKIGSLGRICGSEVIDRMLVTSRAEGRPGAYQRLYWELHRHITEEALVCPLFHPAVYCFADPRVESIRLRNFFPSIRYEEISVQ